MSRVSGTAVVVSVVAGIILQLLPPAFAGRLVSEGGVVESVSALLYAIGVLLVLVQLKLRPSRLWLSRLPVVLWLLLRELDLIIMLWSAIFLFVIYGILKFSGVL